MPLPLSKLCPDYDERIKVFRAINAPVSDLTVAELCEHAGITRKRFYTLFAGKDDVFRWFLDLCFEASLYEIGRSFSWEEGVRACLTYVYEMRDVFAVAVGGRSDPASRYWAMHRKHMVEMTRTLQERGVTMSLTLELEIELYSSAVFALLRRWVEVSDVCSLDTYTACWIDCVPGALEAALELK